MASIYKRKSKTGKGHRWRAVIRPKGHPSICKSFSRKEEAKDWAEAAEYKVKSGDFNFLSHKNPHTFQDLVQRYIDDGLLDHYRAKRDAIRHLNYFSGRMGAYALPHITSELLTKERKLLQTGTTTTGKVRSSSTVNRYMASLSAILSYAYKHLGWISANPCARLKKLKEGPGRTRTLTKEETTSLLHSARGSRSPYLYCVILMGLTTGARRGEILSLKWESLDLVQGTAHIPETKNGTARTLPLAKLLIEELKKLFLSRDKSKPHVFASKSPFGMLDIKNSWQGALKRADINDLRFHDLRHHFSTAMAKKGASTVELKVALGHKTLQMVERYTHLQAESTRKYSEAIANVIMEDINEKNA